MFHPLVQDFDLLTNNNVTLVFPSEITAIIDTEYFQKVNFIKLQILTSTFLSTEEKLREYIGTHPNFEVNIKQINMEKLDVGIIIPFKDIKFIDENDTYIDKLKKDEIVKTLLGSEDVYDIEGKLVFKMDLYRNYLESEDSYEYVIQIKYSDCILTFVYGDVNSRKMIIDFNKANSIILLQTAPNGMPCETIIDEYEESINPNMRSDIKNLVKLINANSIELAFGHLL